MRQVFQTRPVPAPENSHACSLPNRDSPSAAAFCPESKGRGGITAQGPGCWASGSETTCIRLTWALGRNPFQLPAPQSAGRLWGGGWESAFT